MGIFWVTFPIFFSQKSFVPNAPGALYSPPKIKPNTTTWETIMEALPPKGNEKIKCYLIVSEPAIAQISITRLLSRIKGTLPLLGQTFYEIPNTRFHEYYSIFSKNLDDLSSQIAVRNSKLALPYNLLDPKHVANSIYI
jgi:hypothetical protein